MIATPDYDPVYPGVNVEYDAPIAMDDGVQLRADIYRPADAQGRTVEEKLPVIVVPTSYTKLLAAINSAIVDGVPTGTIIDSVVQAVDPVLSNSALDGVNNLLQAIPGGATQLGLGLDKRIVRQGFVQVVVDIRGQGNSPGDYVTLQDGRERRDAADLVEWARTQPWSTGHVGMVGVSYLGSTAMEAAVMKPAGLDAIVPIEPSARSRRTCQRRWNGEPDHRTVLHGIIGATATATFFEYSERPVRCTVAGEPNQKPPRPAR